MKSLIEEFQSDDGDESSQGTPSDQQGGSSAIVFPSISPESQAPTAQLEPVQFEALWTIYATNVNPMVRIFHRPSLRKSLFNFSETSNVVSKRGHDLLRDTVCFAAIVSSTDAECQSILGTTKAISLHSYRSVLERRFGQINLPNTSSLIVLQAFVLFLTCMQRLDESRLVLGWTALAVRVAMCQGLHRDGDIFGLTPFATEIRRRVWWHLILLEYDLSKGHGVDTLIQKTSFTTKMPLNVNDDDITPDILSIPSGRYRFSEMSHSLVRFEIFHHGRDIIYADPVTMRMVDRHGSELKGQENQILELQRFLEERYLQYCSPNIPIQSATLVLARSLCAMLWMSLYHPLQLSADPRASSLKDQLFASMIEVVDNIRRLESDPQSAQWGWYFHNDTQWPALTYLLNELKNRSPGPQMNRAFEVARAARTQWYATNWSTEFHHKMHKPMKLLTTQVLAQGGQLDVDPNSEEYANSIVRERGWDPRLNSLTAMVDFRTPNQMFEAEDFEAWLQQEQGVTSNFPTPDQGVGDSSAQFEAEGSQFGSSDWWFAPYQASLHDTFDASSKKLL